MKRLFFFFIFSSIFSIFFTLYFPSILLEIKHNLYEKQKEKKIKSVSNLFSAFRMNEIKKYHKKRQIKIVIIVSSKTY